MQPLPVTSPGTCRVGEVGDKMSEMETSTIQKMGEAFTKLSPEQKYYILGVGEGMALAKQMAQGAEEPVKPEAEPVRAKRGRKRKERL